MLTILIVDILGRTTDRKKFSQESKLREENDIFSLVEIMFLNIFFFIFENSFYFDKILMLCFSIIPGLTLYIDCPPFEINMQLHFSSVQK